MAQPSQKETDSLLYSTTNSSTTSASVTPLPPHHTLSAAPSTTVDPTLHILWSRTEQEEPEGDQPQSAVSALQDSMEGASAVSRLLKRRDILISTDADDDEMLVANEAQQEHVQQAIQQLVMCSLKPLLLS